MITLRDFTSLAAAIVLGMSVSSAVQAQTNTTKYVVGTLFPLSGANAEFGTMYANAVQLALDHIAEDKLLKKPIELKAQDSLATPQGGATGMTRLASVDEASYVLIGFTGVSKAAAPIGERAKVVMVNGGGVGPDLASLSPYFWNVIPLADREVQAVFPWIKAKGFKRIAMVYTDDPSGIALFQEMEKGLPAIGAKLVESFSVQASTTQFASIAAKIRGATPDAVYFASVSGPMAVQLIKQLRDNGVTQQIITYSTGNLPSVSALPESEGLVFTGQAADWASSEPKIKRFVTGWRTKYKSDPTTYALNYYNATMLFAALAKELEAAGKPVNGENLRAQLLQTRKFSLAGGDVTFADNGTATTAVQLNMIHGGHIEKLVY
jgi:ABC-type branched-subunit amino acid transport system substrate-binding protein